jgi:hypothetical protein
MIGREPEWPHWVGTRFATVPSACAQGADPRGPKQYVPSTVLATAGVLLQLQRLSVRVSEFELDAFLERVVAGRSHR